MKKLLTLACSLALLTTLCACQDATATITDGNSQLVKVGKTTITKADIYESMKSTNGGSATISAITDKLYELEGISVNDEMKKKGKEQFSELKANYKDDETFKNVLKNFYGVESEEEYLEDVAYPSLLNNALTKKYISENSKELFNTYKPRKAIMIQCKNQDDAKKALAELKNNGKATDIAKKYGVKDSTYKGEAVVYTSESSVAKTAFNELSAASKNGIIDKVISDTTTSTDSTTGAETSTTYYYVVKAIEIDPSKMNDEACEAITNSVSTIKTTMMESYLKKHNFEIFDIDIYNAINTSNPTYIINKK